MTHRPARQLELSVIIPTRDRRAILCETLSRLELMSGDIRFEVMIIDDGSADGTPQAVTEQAARRSFALSLIEQVGLGPAAARNRALAAAQAPVCLFINDDTWPAPDLLARHRDFHRRRPERHTALLGRISLSPVPPPTPFERCFAALNFSYAGIDNPDDAGGRWFWTGNVSAKTAFLRDAGGFDESFKRAAHEDTDLGLRLEKQGLKLAYDPDALVEHCHPMDLPTAIDRFRGIGHSLSLLIERHPDWPVPRRPGVAERLKASVLGVPAAIGLRTPWIQQAIWRFLCHEAMCEGYWDSVDGGMSQSSPTPPLEFGGTLLRLASRDPASGMTSAASR
jgi:GT2 family glycosyltransferase